MKKTDLNTIFTAKVNTYLAKGYTFNTDSMAGHQGGEIAKVDLTNGKEVIRILMEDLPFSWNQELGIHLNKGYSIKVGRATEIQPGISGSTIWNNRLEILEQEDFYQVGYYSEDYLVSYEEAVENAKKSSNRIMAKASNTGKLYIEDKAIIKALLPYIHTVNGCKSVKARHITSVKKVCHPDGTFIYQVGIKKKNNTKITTLNLNTNKIRAEHTTC